MPTCICNNIAYIHIPKTAGTSMTQQFKNTTNYIVFNEDYVDIQDSIDFYNMYLDHVPAFLVQKYETDKYYKMLTYVRNPYTRFISMFCQAKKLDLHSYDISIKGIQQFCSEFRDSDYNSEKYKMFFNPMIYYTHDESKRNNLVDYIFRYENLENTIKSVEKIMNVPIKDIPISNQNEMTDNTKYMQWYTNCPMLYDFVNDIYSADFDAFYYDKF
jgi:hypothetical protein